MIETCKEFEEMESKYLNWETEKIVFYQFHEKYRVIVLITMD